MTGAGFGGALVLAWLAESASLLLLENEADVVPDVPRRIGRAVGQVSPRDISIGCPTSYLYQYEGSEACGY